MGPARSGRSWGRTVALPAGSEDAIRNLWKWSNFGATKTVYANQAVRFGDGAIKVVIEMPAYASFRR